MPDAVPPAGRHIEELPSAPHPITGVATSVTAFVGRALRGPVDSDDESPVRIASFADFERIFGGLANDCPMSFAVLHFFANGGTDALIVRVDGSEVGDAQVATGADLRGLKRGLYALDKADLFNLLVIPPYGEAVDVGAATWAAAAAYCTERRALALIDPPYRDGRWDAAARVTPAAIAAVVPRSANAALYFPRVRLANPLRGNRDEAYAPGGAVAGLLARTDAERGVWKAPAGTRAALLGVLAPDVDLNDTDSAQINALGVNGIRRFPGVGTVVWGARTLRGADTLADDYKYIPVRRTALHIEESLGRGLRWATFEPNAEPLWARIRAAVAAFLQDLFRRGAFPGALVHEAYFVKCGADTTTQDDVDRGVVNIVVGFAPLRPAEFVIIRLQQTAGRPGG